MKEPLMFIDTVKAIKDGNSNQEVYDTLKPKKVSNKYISRIDYLVDLYKMNKHVITNVVTNELDIEGIVIDNDDNGFQIKVNQEIKTILYKDVVSLEIVEV